ncbi:diphthine--ammonia ligase [Candidatus Pacearchaeota archaeon]|nr:diphthine--ammonia ligase [Candidatus Pacearchaeota archaeon]
MKLGVLFSGGKDSTLATWLAKKNGYKIECLISIISENKESYMFHTPSISKTKIQAMAMGIPLVVIKTKGKKETELKDLKKAILIAKRKYKIQGIVTGAVESVYQASRIQKICNEFNLECFNPLWQKNQFELLDDLLKNKFEVVIMGVFAYPFDKSWLGRKIDRKFIEEMKILNEKYKINPAGEGGEFESFVLYVPELFKRKLKVKNWEDFGEKNSWRGEVEAE